MVNIHGLLKTYPSVGKGIQKVPMRAENNRSIIDVAKGVQVMTSQNLATRGKGENWFWISAPYKSILGERSLTGRSALFLRHFSTRP